MKLPRVATFNGVPGNLFLENLNLQQRPMEFALQRGGIHSLDAFGNRR